MSISLDLEKGEDNASPLPYSKPLIDTKKEDDIKLTYVKYCADNASVWKRYMRRAEHDDRELAQILNSDLDSLLFFAALFSAVLSAFLIEIRNGPLDAHASRLQWVNGLWLSSLICSLVGAFLASLAKGWVMKYIDSSGENWSVAGPRQIRLSVMSHWRVQRVIRALPLSIHASLFLFSAGLIVYLREDNLAIRATILLLVIGMGVAYITITFLPFFWPHSPFDTPLSGLAHRLRPKNAPPGDHVKAHALAWLLKTGADGDTIRESVQAIAGLPVNERVQAALLDEDSVIRTISEGFSECIKAGDHTLLLSYLLAIYHLVPLGLPAPPHSKSSLVASLFIDPLDKLSVIERGIYEFVLLVKAGIWDANKQSCQEKYTELRDTAIPIMSNCSKLSMLRDISYGEPRSPVFGVDFMKIGLKSPPIIRMQYARSLGELIKHDGFRVEFVARGGIGELKNLRPVGADSVWVDIIRNLLSDTRIRTVNAKQLIEAITAKVEEENIDERERSAGKVAGAQGVDLVLESAGEIVSHMVTSEFVNKIVKNTFYEHSSRVRLLSVKILAKLLKYEELWGNDNTATILITTILKKLHDDDDSVQAASKQALLELKEDAGTTKRMAVPDIIDELVKSARDENVRPLWPLYVETLGKLVEYVELEPNGGTIQLVVATIKERLYGTDEDEDVQTASVGACIELIKIGRLKMDEMDKPTDIAPQEQIYANLTKYMEIVKCMAAPYIIGELVEKASDENWRTRQRSIKVLYELAKHAEIQDNGSIPTTLINTIVAKLHDDDVDVRMASTQALVDWTENPDIARCMAKPSIVDELVNKASDESWRVRHCCVDILGKLVKYVDLPESDDNIGRKLIATIKEKLCDVDYDVRTAAMRAFIELVEHGRARWTTDGMINVVVEKLNDEAEAVRSASVSILIKLMKDGTWKSDEVVAIFTEQLKAPGLASVQSLIDLLDDVDTAKLFAVPDLIDELTERASNENYWAARKICVKALGELAKYVEFQENHSAVQKLTTTIKEKLCDDDDDVRVVSMQAFIDLVKNGFWKMAEMINPIVMSPEDQTLNESTKDMGTMKRTALPDIIDKLVNNTTHWSWQVRQLSVQALGELVQYVKTGQDDVIVKILITTIVEKLHDGDEDVRAAGVRALARFGKNDATVTTAAIISGIVPHITDAHITVQAASLDILTELANETDVPNQTSTNNRGKDDGTVFGAIVTALVKQAETGVEDVTPSVICPSVFSPTEIKQDKRINEDDNLSATIIDKLSDPNESVRALALVHLVGSKDTRKSITAPIIAEVIKNLGHKDEGLRRLNARCLLAMAQSEEEPQADQARAASLKGLVEFAKKNTAFLHEIKIKEIVGLVKDPNIRVNRHVADTLGQLADFDEIPNRESAINCLFQLKGSKERDVRIASVRSLVRFALHDGEQKKKIIKAITETLEDREDAVQVAGAHALVKVANLEDMSELINYVEHKESGVRLASLKILIELKSNQNDEGGTRIPDDIVIAIIKRLRDDDQRVRIASIDALAQLAKSNWSGIGSQNILAIIDMLRNKRTFIRDSAITVLSELGEISASPNLLSCIIDLLADSDVGIVQSGVKLLSRLAEEGHFNAGARLPSSFWDKVVHLLTQPETRTLGLQSLSAFAKQEAMKEAMRTGSAIVPALLEMRRDISSWHLGTFALLELGLFDLPT